MPLWKQRLFSRLQRPADGDGSDLGGSTATESAIDAIGVVPDAPDTSAVDAAVGSAVADEDSQDTAQHETKTATPMEKVSALLDSLTDDPNAQKPAAAKLQSEEDQKPPVAPDKKGQSATDSVAKPKPEQEEAEAELLDGVKSERGRERIKQVFAERKALEQDVNEFKSLVQSSGMSAEEFAQTLEFGRLVSSGDEANLRTAIEMVEAQRTMLYGKLGIEAPGVDLLSGHADLKDAVDNMEMTREKAVELAKLRKSEAERTSRATAERKVLVERQDFEKTVTQATGALEAYLGTRAAEVDHPARMKALGAHFSKPENLQAFVQTYRPDQWQATIKIMYDNIQVARPAPNVRDQPLRTRPAALGTPAATSGAPIDRVASRLDAMGI